MAVGWIKFRKSLLTDGRVRIVARKCNCTKGAVLGGLISLWSLADEHANDSGEIIGYTQEDIDEEAEIPGFCDALPEDWIDLSGEFIQLPNYLEHNGGTAKKRIDASRRKRKQRDMSQPPVTNVTKMSHDVVTNVTEPCDKSVTRTEQNRTEQRRTENKPPKPPKGDGESLPDGLDPAFRTDEFREVWSEWVEHRKQKRSKLTPVAIRNQVKKMNEMGPDRSIRALVHSMTNGWSGIFEPDARGHPRNDSRGSIDQSEYEKFLSAGESSG